MPRFSPGCKCCDCSSGSTKICGTVTANCGSVAGLTVSASGPASLSTTTDNSGAYCFDIVKKGTYTVTLNGPCGDQTYGSPVDVPSCGGTVSGIDFAITYPTLTITASSDCVDPVTLAYYVVNGPGLATQTCPLPLKSALPFTLCATPNSTYTITFCDDCYNPQTETVAVGCTDVTHNVALTSATYNLYATAQACAGGGAPLRDATITIAGTAGNWTGVTDSNGDFGPVPLKAQCTYTVTVAKTGYVTTTFPTLGTPYFTMSCNDVDGRGTSFLNLSPPVAPGYQCWGSCCDDPFTDPLTVTDAQGTHSFFNNNGIWQTDCIEAAGKDCYCVTGAANDCGNAVNGSIAYWYTVTCDGTSWTLTRHIPACSLVDGYHPLNSVCNADGSISVAQCGGGFGAGTFAAGESVTVAKDHSACGPLSLSGFDYSFAFADSASIQG